MTTTAQFAVEQRQSASVRTVAYVAIGARIPGPTIQHYASLLLNTMEGRLAGLCTPRVICIVSVHVRVFSAWTPLPSRYLNGDHPKGVTREEVLKK